MALIKWNGREVWEPFQELEDIQREMNRLFDRSLIPTRQPSFPAAELKEWLPPMDIVEEKDRILVRTDIPGMKQEEIHVEVEDGALVIKGERKREQESKEGQVHRVERSYGSFFRSFTLPTSVDEAKVSASYKNGVLEVALPKKEGTKPKPVKVEVK